MKKLIGIFFLLMSVASFAQNRYTAVSSGENPPYGLVSQLWNASASTIYVEAINVTGAQSVPGVLIFGFGQSALEESQCTAVTSYRFGANSAITGPVDVRVSSQPCTPHGQPYSPSNYTPTNFVGFEVCFVASCRIEFAMPLPIAPQTGVTIYTALYPNLGWLGHVGFSFRWHDHLGCPAVPINNLFCIQ